MKAETQRIERQRAEHEMRLREFLAKFMCLMLGICCAATLSIFLFQGFHARGFGLQENILHWLGAATLGEIGTLASIVYSALFRNTHTTARRRKKAELNRIARPASIRNG